VHCCLLCDKLTHRRGIGAVQASPQNGMGKRDARREQRRALGDRSQYEPSSKRRGMQCYMAWRHVNCTTRGTDSDAVVSRRRLLRPVESEVKRRANCR